MTYCCGILVRDGLVMIADTRTNAGLDNVSTFRKLHVYTQPGERIMAIASSGNLSLTPIGALDPHRGRRKSGNRRARNADEFADHVPGGAAHRPHHPQHPERRKARRLEAAEVDHDVAFLFGGQIKGGRVRLFMIYSAGNFIECTTDTPYLQIGEHKYGKPVLDRAISFDTDLYDALKIGLISMDSTMRSNLGVGLPIDILVVRRDDLQRRGELPHRAGRALFPGPARALVGRAARRPYRHSAPALSQRRLNPRPRSRLPRLTPPRELRYRAASWPGRRGVPKANSKLSALVSGAKSSMGRTT